LRHHATGNIDNKSRVLNK
jgi:hypothetical protein